MTKRTTNSASFLDHYIDNAELVEGLDETGVYKSDVKVKREFPMERKFRKRRGGRLIAYDLETTNIDVGTPTPLYLTAYSDTLKVSRPVSCFDTLRVALETYLLTPDNSCARFVAWAGNRFDVVLIALALKENPEWLIVPSLTRSKNVRSLRVQHKTNPQWQYFFLDGMAMTGLDAAGTPLRDFVAKYAPEFPKLAMDFGRVTFDANNAEHVLYAERDAESLYHAITRCDAVVKKLTGGNGLTTTMGRCAIDYLTSKLPAGIKIWRANDETHKTLHTVAKRGGYVWIMHQYQGPVWKYDINQAYAAAMRDELLPAGELVSATDFVADKCGLYHVMIKRKTPSPIPFYCKAADTGKALYVSGKKPIETWLLSNEIKHLRGDGWDITFIEGCYWGDTFSLKDMVDELEALRFTDPDGPSGALGSMVKALGNMSYGKTLEELDGVEYIVSKESPGEEWSRYMPEDSEFVYFKAGEAQRRAYHRPQLGCFITAHVRCKLRAAALGDSEAFIYGDTDSVAFLRPAKHLEIDARRYGAWKMESAGDEHLFIAKKVYMGGGKIHAKGLRVRELSAEKMRQWYQGKPPAQEQIQRNNFLSVLGGQDMFRRLDRRGTDVTISKSVRFNGGEFSPLD